MEGLKRTLALAAFEARQNRRLVRVWVLGILSLVIPLGQTAQMFFIHRFASGFNGSWSSLTRDFVVLNPLFTHAVVLGLCGVFHVFDWRHRDVSRHFAGTLDAMPLTRVQHAWGKFLGFVPAIIAPFAILIMAQLITTLVGSVHVPWQVYVMSYGLVGLPLALTAPALAFGLAGLIRNQALGRALGITAGIGWLVLSFGSSFTLPEKYAVLLGVMTDMPIWSDWVGYELEPVSRLQPVWAVVVIALFVSLAALGPLGLPQSRRERASRGALAAGLALVVIGLSATSGVLFARGNDRAQAILEAEEAAVSDGQRVTVLRRDVELDLSAKRRLSATATLHVLNDGELIEAVRLRLNPGLVVTSATADGRALSPVRRQSVIELPLALAPGATATLQIAYEGRVDAAAADPRALLVVRKADAVERNNRRLFGTVPAYLHRNVVVLPMDCGFYPDPAVLHGAKAPLTQAPSLAPSRLALTLPDGWTAAATGRREGEGRSVTFVSEEPLSGLAVAAGRYEERSFEAHGTRFRLLFHPGHARNVELFGPSAAAIRTAVEEAVEEMTARTGLRLPSELSVVDVPQLMATFVGTWDSPNRLGQPGVVFAKEGALFGARFEQPLKSALEKAAKTGGSATSPSGPTGASGTTGTTGASGAAGAGGAEGGRGLNLDEVRVSVLERFFATDFTGGSVPRLAMRSAWDARVRPAGDGAAILGPALSSFVAEVATGTFSVDTAETARIINGPAIGQVIVAMREGRDAEIPDIVMAAIADPDDAYAQMTEVPLQEMDPLDKPREWAAVLYMKGRRPMRALRERLGEDAFAQVLARLARTSPQLDDLPMPSAQRDIPTEVRDAILEQQRVQGLLTWTRFREAVLIKARPEDREQLTVLLDNWLSGTALPGFVVEEARAFRIAQEPERWQVLVTVRNDGTAEGLARLVAGEGSDALPLLVTVPPGGRVEAGLLSPRKIDQWRLEPYLALNRKPPSGAITIVDAPADAVPLTGQREAPPSTQPPRVVVDNLDPGFRVVLEDEPIAFAARDDEGERLLKDWPGWRQPATWRRWRFNGRWARPYGTFDETAAVKKGSEDGKHPASWTAELPAGAWRVETYLPPKDNQQGPDPAPQFEYVVRHAAGEDTVQLALDGTQPGWSDLGRFRFDGTAEVRLLDKGDGLVVADAIRFTKETE